MLTEQQLRERKHYIGGSDAGAICGFCKRSSARDVYFSKIEEEINEEIIKSPWIDWGNELEPLIRSKFTKITGIGVKESPETRFHTKHKFLAANVDGITSDGNLLEIKCVGLGSRKYWDDSYIPDQYLCQCAHYAMIYEVPKVYIAAFFGIDMPLKIYTYERNERFEEKLLNKLIRFWENHIIPQQPPLPSTYEEVRSAFKEDLNGSPKIATNEICDRFYRLKSLIEKKEEIDQAIKKDKAVLMNYMENSSCLCENNGNRLCTWKVSKSNRFDLKSFREADKETYNKYLLASKQRRFVVY